MGRSPSAPRSAGVSSRLSGVAPPQWRSGDDARLRAALATTLRLYTSRLASRTFSQGRGLASTARAAAARSGLSAARLWRRLWRPRLWLRCGGASSGCVGVRACRRVDGQGLDGSTAESGVGLSNYKRKFVSSSTSARVRSSLVAARGGRTALARVRVNARSDAARCARRSFAACRCASTSCVVVLYTGLAPSSLRSSSCPRRARPRCQRLENGPRSGARAPCFRHEFGPSHAAAPAASPVVGQRAADH